MAYTTTIGDSQEKAEQPVVSSLPISIVEEALIVDKDSAVNNAALSGKKEGATYVMRQTADDKLIIVVAGGTETTDVWYRQDDLTTPITPA